MLDLFVIFSKGGIVFWCFQGANLAIAQPVNALIKSVILQERGGGNGFNYESLKLQYKLDNEFELVFVVGYQNILQLSYIDRLLDDMQRAFRERYRAVLENGTYNHCFDFDDCFHATLKQCETEDRERAAQKKKMRTFEETNKYTKSKEGSKTDPLVNKQPAKVEETKVKEVVVNGEDKSLNAKDKLLARMAKRGDRPGSKQNKMKQNKLKQKETPKPTVSEKPEKPEKKVKVARVWDTMGKSSDTGSLDYSGISEQMDGETQEKASGSAGNDGDGMLGSMKGDLQSVGNVETSSEEEDEEEVVEEEVVETAGAKVGVQSSGKGITGGIFSFFKGLAGGKTLTKQDIDPVLEKMKEHLIAKNVAADISDQLCNSVATKLEGKVLGTFSGVTSTVKASLQESLMQILSPRRRVDILRDVMEAKKRGKPYVIAFCGVNGVGKSTNLAKICFWLLDNGYRVLVSACDTFRAGAVEQLRTHHRSLSAIHKPVNETDPARVLLYEKGYGKDAASIAMDSVRYARDAGFDVVLIDTAGRMQDNEPLMRALAKLIKLNAPDLVLFVGEALVGNEAVDQLTKFNRALADYSNEQNPRLIDGILLTKFDTIDDKVGAAISMTYTTGQPIVFVGTGQTYTDLRSLNPKAVVNALLKA